MDLLCFTLIRWVAKITLIQVSKLTLVILLEMTLKMKVWKNMSEYDVLQFDGAYLFGIKEFVDAASKDGVILKDANFFAPIRKQVGIEFTASEKRHNARFGALRSMIETHFARVENTFQRFHPSSRARCGDLKVFNLQWKFASLMINIRRAVDLFEYEVPAHHKKWMHKDFDFEIKKDPEPDQRVNAEEVAHNDIIKDQEEFIKSMMEKEFQGSDGSHISHNRTHQVLHDAQETIQNILNEDAAAENESETSNEEQVESESETSNEEQVENESETSNEGQVENESVQTSRGRSQRRRFMIPYPSRYSPITTRILHAQQAIGTRRSTCKRKIRSRDIYSPSPIRRRK